MTDVVTRSSRYAALDLLRGLAILGTLATNIWIFTNPEGLVGYLADSTAATSSGWAGLATVLQQLAQGKFLGLLTLMFGIGLQLQRDSARRARRAWPGPYPWRAALLFVDGVLHYVLVVEFDVLMGYAVTGLVVAYLLATSERAQRRWMRAAALVHLTLLTLLTLVIIQYAAGDVRSTSLDPNPYAEGSWLDLVKFRLDNAAFFRFEPVFITALSVAQFLLGARLVRLGVLTAGGHRLRIRLLQIGGVALVLDLVIGLGAGLAGTAVSRYGTAPVVALGLLALVVELFDRLERRRLTGWVSSVGRAALSCYVLQNLTASFLCYGWGLGFAARTPTPYYVPVTLALYAVTAVVVTIFANLWLRRFSRGPVEMAWLSTYQAITASLPSRVSRG